MGSAAFAAALALPSYGNPNFLQGIKEGQKKKKIKKEIIIIVKL